MVTRWGASRLPRKPHRGLRKARALQGFHQGLRVISVVCGFLTLPVRVRTGVARRRS